jgi:hypothetical protein
VLLVLLAFRRPPMPASRSYEAWVCEMGVVGTPRGVVASGMVSRQALPTLSSLNASNIN